MSSTGRRVQGTSHLSQLIVLAHLRSPTLFSVLVRPGDFVSRVAECMQYLIELGMYGLCVAMLRALDYQRHKPGG